MKNKRILIKILSLICLICISCGAFVAVGCGKEKDKITFKTTEMKYMVGDNVDCFSFVEWMEGYDFHFSIQLKGEEKITEVSGRTFVVHTAGDYNLFVKAIKDKTVLEDSTEITVYHTIPVAMVPNSDMVKELYDEVPLFSLLSMNGGVRLISSDSKTITLIDSGTYYENETDTEGDVFVYYDTSLPLDNFNLAEYRKKKIHFDKEGIWYFSVHIQNEGGVTKGKFRVTITENLDKMEDVTDLVGATFNEDTLQASWGAVDGAVGYRAKVRSYVLSTENTSADMSNAYYPPFNFFDFVVVPYDADGKNIGKKIVIENCVVSPEGYKGVVLNEKASLDQKERVVTLNSARISQQYWWSGINGTVDKSANGAANVDPINGFVGMKGDYGVGYYVETVFGESTEDVGQIRVSYGSCNMPQIILFADEINGNKSDLGGKGLLLSSGLGAWTGNSWLPSLENTVNYFGVHGPNRATYIGGKTELPTLVKTTDYPLLTQNGMKEFGGGKTYKYIVGTKYSEWGTVLIDITLLVQQGNDFVEIKTADGKSYTNILLDTWLNEEDIAELGTNIVLIAENKFNTYQSTTKFKFEMPVFKSAGTVKATAIANDRTVKGEAGTITLNSANIASSFWWTSLDGTVDTTVQGAAGANPVNGYLAFTGDYGVGYYVQTEFGASKENIDGTETDFGSCNMPQIVLFADDINGNKTHTGGKGILLSSGLGAWWENTACESLTATMDYFGVHGPNRATYIGAKTELPTLVKTSDYPLLTQNGMKELGGGKTYRYIVGTKYSEWGTVLVDITLLVKDGNEFKEIKTADGKSYTNVLFETYLTKADVEQLGTNIILMAENKHKTFNATTTFKFELPEFKDAGTLNPTFTAKINDKVVSHEKGMVTLNAANIASGTWWTSLNTNENGYLAFTGNFGVGYYIETEFGASKEYIGTEETDFGSCNMPQIILFADNVNGYKSSTGGKGLLLSSGMGAWADNTAISSLTNALNYFSVHGPTRATYSSATNVPTLVKTNEYPLLTQNGMKEFGGGKTYKYIVGTKYSEWGRLLIDITLLVKDGEEFKEITTAGGKKYTNILLDTGLTKADVEQLGTNIILLADNKHKVYAPSTTFSYKLPEFKDAGYETVPQVQSSGATFNADGSLSMPNKGVMGVTAKTAGTWAEYYNYFAIKGNYGVGYYMDFKFTGINMPQLILFANGTHTSAYQSLTNYGTGKNQQNSTQQGRKGVVILNGLHEKGDYLQVFGPNRMDGSNEYGATGKGELLSLSKEQHLELTRTGQKQNLTKEYALTIGTFIGSDSKVWIDILLKDAKTGATIHSVQASLGLTAEEVGTGDIIILPPLGIDGDLITDGTTTCVIDYLSIPYLKTQIA